MNALEELLRHALGRYEPPPLAQALRPHVPEHRPLTAYEGTLPRWLPEPYGPDPLVFGPQRDYTPPDEGGQIYRRCREHAVEWCGYGVPCWCCEAGIKPC